MAGMQHDACQDDLTIFTISSVLPLKQIKKLHNYITNRIYSWHYFIILYFYI